MIVVKPQFTAGEALLRPVAAHPVPWPIGQCLAIGLGMPPAQGHVPLHVFLLALLARVLSVSRISHPAGICRPDVVVFDDKLEIAAGTLESH